MIRQSRKWSENIAAASFVFLLLASHLANGQTASGPTGTAGTSYFGQSYVDPGVMNNINGKYGTADGLNMNLLIPYTTGTQMTSVNSAATFTAQMFCPSAKKFFTLTILPSATGDISVLAVDEDLNLDGATDYSFSLPAGTRVSGVCANGYISCDEGTWNNCAYYEWISNASGGVGSRLVSSDAVGGCFCINNNCGSNIILTNGQIILETLGGGAVATVQGSNAHLAVTKTSIDPVSISYFAQDTRNCTIGAAAAGLNDQTSYYGNSGSMDADASVEQGVETGDSNSLYSKLLTSKAMTSSTSDYRSCSVVRSLNVNTLNAAPTYAWLPWLDLSCHVYMGRDSSNGIAFTNLIDTVNDFNLVYDLVDTPWEGAGGIGCGADEIAACYSRLDGYVAHYQTVYGVSVLDVQKDSAPSAAGWSDGGGRHCDRDQAWVTHYRWERKSPPICDLGYTYVEASNRCYQESHSLSINDGCSVLSTDTSCVKKEEIDDGVFVFRNYATTGLMPIETCKTLPGVLGTYTECAPWWEKHLVYRCTPISYDFSSGLNRNAHIESTTHIDADGLHYQDLVNGLASDHTVSYNAAMDGASSSCENACKTRKPVTDTAASGSTTRANTNNSTSGYAFFIKKCTDAGCPVDADAGESIVLDCRCMSGFAEGATALDIIGEAGDDMICTTGLTP